MWYINKSRRSLEVQLRQHKQYQGQEFLRIYQSLLHFLIFFPFTEYDMSNFEYNIVFVVRFQL